MVCTFFGHSDAPKDIYDKIETVIVSLIKHKNITTFYVGNNGNFDRMVYTKLKELSAFYTFEYFVVLSYLPNNKKEQLFYYSYENTIYPESLEQIPPRFAISNRNKWMINQSDIVVTYVLYTASKSAKFKEMAEKRGKTVINIV